MAQFHLSQDDVQAALGIVVNQHKKYYFIYQVYTTYSKWSITRHLVWSDALAWKHTVSYKLS